MYRNELLNNKKILLLKNNYVEHPDNQKESKPYVSTLLMNMVSKGYTLDEKSINYLLNIQKNHIIEHYKEIEKILEYNTGCYVDHDIFYPNFPSQLIETDECELALNSIFHYITLGKWKPTYKTKKRFPLIDKVEPILLTLDFGEKIKSYIKELLESASSLSESEIIIITEYVKHNGVFKATPVFKENLAIYNMLLYNYGDKENITFNSLTDILRFISTLHNQNSSLTKPVIFKKISRKERREILGFFDDFLKNNTASVSSYDSLKKYQKVYILLGEILHPGEYKNRYPYAFKLFDLLRNNKISDWQNVFWNSDNFIERISVLSPGMFARYLDYLLRTYPEKSDYIIKLFYREAGASVSTRVLIQLLNHFQNRNDKKYRTFMLKSRNSSHWTIENNLPNLDNSIIDSVVDMIKNVLINKFIKLGSFNKNPSKLEKVFIDPELKNIAVPLQKRNQSLHVPRGSKIPIGKDKYLRLFIHWKNNSSSTVDVDLSTIFHNENIDYMGDVSYTNLKNTKLGVIHSGDIIDAPNGASEFIDIDREKLLNNGVKFVSMNVLSYSGQSFKDIPDCFCGIMERDDLNSGRVFEPSTVDFKIDLIKDSKILMPFVFDIENNNLIVVDMETEGYYEGGNNIESYHFHQKINLKSIIYNSWFSYYDLLELHVKGRGGLTLKKKDADVVLGLDDIDNNWLK